MQTKEEQEKDLNDIDDYFDYQQIKKNRRLSANGEK
jgi:hypothetical protein